MKDCWVSSYWGVAWYKLVLFLMFPRPNDFVSFLRGVWRSVACGCKTLKCLSRSPRWRKLLWHSEQLKGLQPVWISWKEKFLRKFSDESSTRIPPDGSWARRSGWKSCRTVCTRIDAHRDGSDDAGSKPIRWGSACRRSCTWNRKSFQRRIKFHLNSELTSTDVHPCGVCGCDPTGPGGWWSACRIPRKCIRTAWFPCGTAGAATNATTACKTCRTLRTDANAEASTFGGFHRGGKLSASGRALTFERFDSASASWDEWCWSDRWVAERMRSAGGRVRKWTEVCWSLVRCGGWNGTSCGCEGNLMENIF